MEFFIEYETYEGNSDSLCYSLFENEVVDAWLECIQIGRPELNFGFYGLSRLDIAEVSLKLAAAYEKISEKLLEKDQNIDVSKILIDGAVDQHLLNRLHAIFHHYKDRDLQYGLTGNTYQEILQQLNGLVHLLESQPHKNSYQFIINPVRNYRGVEIPDHWYKKYFSGPEQHGDLVLGYGTVGKELLEIYKTKDVKNLNLISPQKYVYGEFRQIFNGEINYISTEQLRLWCAESGKSSLHERELYTFRPKLGKIKTDLSFKQLRQKCLTFKKVLGVEVD